MNAEEMKSAWNAVGSPGASESEALLAAIREGRRKTALEELKTYYKRFSLLALAFSFISMSYYGFDFIRDDLRLALVISFFIFFMTESVLDYWLYMKVSEIDIFTMKVSEVAERAMKCRHYHHLTMLIMLCFSFAVLGFFFYSITDKEGVVLGMVCGGVAGLAIGLRIYFKMMRNYRELYS